MSDREVRERDILVASNEYAYVQDLTKGDIVLYVGPTKISLSNTERLVDFRSDRFVPVRTDDGSGISAFVTASSSQYIILENPTKDLSLRPIKGNNSSVELLIGRKVVVPGPASFPLWPGQRARTIDGHELREDEYLVVRVYERLEGDAPIGTETIVRGSDTSFYIPRNGLEVVRGTNGYVRKAYRLRKGFGLHLRVVKPFVAAEGELLPAGTYAAGQDIFLADREGYFFPTENLEIVGEVSSIPLAERDGLYARDLTTGHIDTITGPLNYLPDPTRVEVATRALDAETAKLYGVSESEAEDGHALSVYVPSGYAVLVTAKTRREVVCGPVVRILAFDEDLEVLELSTGKPKTQERTLRTCFLLTEGNKVSDIVRVRTRDHNELEIVLSYRVTFMPQKSERWFHVKDYVQLLCDHAGSLVRAAARQASIETFYGGSAEIVRAAVLGEKKDGEPRAGRLFEENGMWVYDLEVLEVKILDAEVKSIVADAQRSAMMADVARRQELARLETEKLKEEVSRGIYGAQMETATKAVELELARRTLATAQVDMKIAIEGAEKSGRAKNEAEAVGILAVQRIEIATREAELERRASDMRVAAFKEQMAALQPELITTLKTLGNQKLAGELSRNMAPLAILGGESVSDVVERLIGSLPVGANDTVKKVLPVKK